MSKRKAPLSMDDVAGDIAEAPSPAPPASPAAEDPPAAAEAPLVLSGLVTLAVDSIDDNGPYQSRRVAPTPEEDAGLVASISALGILTPVIVVEDFDQHGRFKLLEGHRRLRAARAIGLPTVPAVFGPRSEGARLAAGIAANVQRAPMDPVDQWRAIVALQERGYSLAGAAQSLGIEERLARRLDKLGRLHPDVLTAIEGHGVPVEAYLSRIAAAPFDVQAQAIKAKDAWHGSGAKREPVWYRISERCTTRRIPRDRAIFDTELAGVAWDEDLFAEPGDEEQFTTTDIDGFVAAQKAALEKRMEELGDKRLRPAEVTRGIIKLPKGWEELGTYKFKFDEPKKWPKGAVAFARIDEDGHLVGALHWALAKPPTPPKPAKATAQGGKFGEGASPLDVKRALGGAGSGDEDPTEDEDGDEQESFDPPPTPTRTREPLTQKGREMLAEAKTTALRCALRDRTPPDTFDLVKLLVLALTANNVRVDGEPGARYRATDFDDLAARILDPEGNPREMTEEEIGRVGAEAVARILICSPTKAGNGSGDAAEWIGHMIDAEAALPRLDTAELLATVNGDTLRAVAPEHGINPKGSTKLLREQLAGNAERLRLPGSAFRAEGPEEVKAPPAAKPGEPFAGDDAEISAVLLAVLNAAPLRLGIARHEWDADEILGHFIGDSSDAEDLAKGLSNALGVDVPVLGEDEVETLTVGDYLQQLRALLPLSSDPQADASEQLQTDQIFAGDHEGIAEEIGKVLITQFGVASTSLTPNAELVADLDLDPGEAQAIATALADAFALEISLEPMDAATFHAATLQDLATAVTARLPQRPAPAPDGNYVEEGEGEDHA